MRHVVWDWNGTLLDDFALNVSAVGESCASVGGGPVTADRYRTHFTRPISVSYERLLGRPIGEGEWDRLVRVDGQPAKGGGTKREFLDRHLHHVDTALGGLGRDEVLMVGDSLDDAEAASPAGVRCILVASGPHHADALATTGLTVVAWPVEALTVATA